MSQKNLTIKKGQEHMLSFSNNIYDEDAFMYPAYQQALSALLEIVNHAKHFGDLEFSQELYGYSQNIIAFSGKRGQGKTSTMISFSSAMSLNGLQNKEFEECRFEVLPAFDPTIMEKEQSVLSVILSRMYKLAETKWNVCLSSTSACGNTITEAQKNDLLNMFQKVLTNINAIKYRKGKDIKGLLEIDEISDSAVLKENLYYLTQELLKFGSDKRRKSHQFLVIQLDDTDFQVEKGYDILEDIRKFLSIPNVIVLLATDMNMLRTVVLQHYITEFKDGLSHNIIDSGELREVESKYIDKFIPPTHVIHLPKLDECILRYGNKVNIAYCDEEGNNLLLNSSSYKLPQNKLSAQELILRFIYRKTGIAFAAPSTYYHNIIPTTLRGLLQLLRVLSTMKDVPVVCVDNNTSTQQLKEVLKEKVDVLETNLPLFENYFVNEWAEAKLSKNHAKVIRNMINMVPNDRIVHITKQLKEIYPFVEYPNTSLGEYPDFILFLNNILSLNRERQDYCFIFAIRAYLTILNHKAAVQQMRKTIDEHKEGLLVFDFSPRITALPRSYYVPENLFEYYGSKMIVLQKESFVVDDHLGKIANYLLTEVSIGDQQYFCFNFMNILTLTLSYGASDFVDLINKETSQQWLYDVQMAALYVACNLDVQDKIYKAFDETRDEPGEALTYKDTVERLYARMGQVISAINCSVSEVHSMVEHDMVELIDCLNVKDETAYIAETIAKFFEMIDRKYGTRSRVLIRRLVDIYSDFLSVAEKLSEGTVYEELENAVFGLINRSEDFNRIVRSRYGYDVGFDFSNLDFSSMSEDDFSTIFQKQFSKICRMLNINMRSIKRMCDRRE